MYITLYDFQFFNSIYYKKKTMNFVELFIIFVIIVILIMYINSVINSEVEYVKSKVDGRMYLVRSLSDKQKAADMLAEINQDLQKLVKHMIAKYPENNDCKRLYANYNPDAISEGSPDSGYTSYSVNKGEAVIICIRQKDNSFVDKNIVLYPAIHELGHIMTSEIGHTPLFWNNFKWILKESVSIGIYKKVDFDNKSEDYCGIKIKSSVI